LSFSIGVEGYLSWGWTISVIHRRVKTDANTQFYCAKFIVFFLRLSAFLRTVLSQQTEDGMSQKWFDDQEDRLVKDLNEGRITPSEYDKQMRELLREYRHMAEDSAQDAYDREMGNW
jgi:hypothetical protein